jgi:hypothetical protein
VIGHKIVRIIAPAAAGMRNFRGGANHFTVMVAVPRRLPLKKWIKNKIRKPMAYIMLMVMTAPER